MTPIFTSSKSSLPPPIPSTHIPPSSVYPILILLFAFFASTVSNSTPLDDDPNDKILKHINNIFWEGPNALFGQSLTSCINSVTNEDRRISLLGE